MTGLTLCPECGHALPDGARSCVECNIAAIEHNVAQANLEIAEMASSEEDDFLEWEATR